MKKRAILIALAFLVCIGIIKSIDINNRYEISIIDYIKYSMPLSNKEINYLKSNSLEYGIDIKDAPFSFISYDTNQNVGILIDYFNQLSVTLEKEFECVPYENYNLAIKLKAGEIDAAVLNKTKMNQEVFLFTQPLYVERSKILVRGDSSFENATGISNIAIAVITGTTAHHVANNYFHKNQNVKLVLTDSLDESFYLFGMGEVDAILGDEAKISYHLNQAIRDNRFKFLKGSIATESVAVAINRGETVLYDILNKGILEMKKNNQYSHIHSKWFGSFIPEIKDISNSGLTADVVILIMAVILGFLFWNQTVSHRVIMKTRELNESRQELKDILDSLMDGVIVTDRNGEINACNKTALDLFHISAEEAMGHNIYDIPAFRPYLEHVNEKESFKNNGFNYLVTKRKFDYGSEKQLLIIEDYTERYRYESLTRQEAKMIAVGELSAGLAHEIRNPLGLIKNYIYFLKKKANSEIASHGVQVIDESVDRINSLIENLLQFSRLTVEKAPCVSIEKTISDIIMLERKNLEKNEIKVISKFNLKDCITIRINEDVIKLVLINLINNSTDALKDVDREEKRIEIYTDIEGEYLRIIFKDNGSGISKDNLDMIFNPFFTTKETGTGLGLYIVSSELRNIDGQISAESIEGKGTVFQIRVPIIGENDGQ